MSLWSYSEAEQNELESGAEKNIFEIVWRTRFLSVRDAVEDEDTVILVLWYGVLGRGLNVWFWLRAAFLWVNAWSIGMQYLCLPKTYDNSTYEDVPRG